MVRTLDGRVRAFLSHCYRPLDHHDLAEAVLPSLVNSKAEVHSCEITPTRMYIKEVVPGIQQTAPPTPDREDYEPAILRTGVLSGLLLSD